MLRSLWPACVKDIKIEGINLGHTGKRLTRSTAAVLVALKKILSSKNENDNDNSQYDNISITRTVILTFAVYIYNGNTVPQKVY